MSGDKLSDLQRRLLALLAEIKPRWTLTGGAALAGFHTKRRPTRDLDLFWRNRSELLDTPRDVAERLRRAGLEVEVVQTTPTFHQLRVSDGTATCAIDLVAEPGDSLEPPVEVLVSDVVVRVDSAHRSELRDLADIEALLELEPGSTNRESSAFSH